MSQTNRSAVATTESEEPVQGRCYACESRLKVGAVKDAHIKASNPPRPLHLQPGATHGSFINILCV